MAGGRVDIGGGLLTGFVDLVSNSFSGMINLFYFIKLTVKESGIDEPWHRRELQARSATLSRMPIKNSSEKPAIKVMIP